MIENNLFTVLILSYNNLQYIQECLDSILNQDYPYIEIVVSDDCSENFDENKIRKYINENKKENIVNFIINQNEENLVTVKNLNKAIKLGNGNYFMNLACDDKLYDENVISSIVNFFDKTDYLGMTGFIEMCRKDMSSSGKKVPDESSRIFMLNNSSIKIYRRLCKELFLVGPGFSYRKELIEIYGLYDEEYSLIEDFSRYLYLTRNGCPIGFIDKCIVKYRTGVGSFSKTKSSEDSKIKQLYIKDSNLIKTKEIKPYN